jgi:hypothetical protein
MLKNIIFNSPPFLLSKFHISDNSVFEHAWVSEFPPYNSRFSASRFSGPDFGSSSFKVPFLQIFALTSNHSQRDFRSLIFQVHSKQQQPLPQAQGQESDSHRTLFRFCNGPIDSGQQSRHCGRSRGNRLEQRVRAQRAGLQPAFSDAGQPPQLATVPHPTE